MTSLVFEHDGWLGEAVDGVDDENTLTRFRISVGNRTITKNFSKRGGGESTSINVPLLPLCSHLAANWWPLLYEPLKKSGDERFQARHRLDIAMHGYVFPALAVCSAGEETILVDWRTEEQKYSSIEFRTVGPPEPIQLARADVETSLMDLVETAVERSGRHSRATLSLLNDWNRIRETLSTPSEAAYCMAAGRLGLDPYDADASDLTAFTNDIDPKLFCDISDVVDMEEIGYVTDWTREAKERLAACPAIDVDAFGTAPRDNIAFPAWMTGLEAAGKILGILGLSDKPKKAVGELLGAAVKPEHSLSKDGPSSLTSLLFRDNGIARVGTVARSARQQRFRACVATYLAWVTDPGDERAGTHALTRRQQASRAFAAEMLAPRNYLLEQANRLGLTTDDLEQQASQLICPFETVLWQAVRAGIPLRGIELPLSQHAGLFGSTAAEAAPAIQSFSSR